MTVFTLSLCNVKNHEALVEKSNSLLITRSDRPYSDGLKNLGVSHYTSLAPSWDLYKKSQVMKSTTDFDNWYDTIYKPLFVKGLKNYDTLKLLKSLSEKSKTGEDIALICFCTKERCHRHIIAEIISRLSNADVVELHK